MHLQHTVLTQLGTLAGQIATDMVVARLATEIMATVVAIRGAALTTQVGLIMVVATRLHGVDQAAVELVQMVME